MTALLKLATAAVLVLASSSAHAATLKITVTNTTPKGGFSITPLWAAFHNGAFDAFDSGAAASAGVELIAELGDASGLAPELLAADPGATATVIAAAANGIPPIEPGETASVTIDVDPISQRFFSFLTMLVPSNDTFLGNDNPLATMLFDIAGTFLGPQTLYLTGLDIFDAGTEANDPANGPAFVVGQNALIGGAGEGSIQQGLSLASFAGVTVPGGTLLDGALIDFTTDPRSFNIAKIEISAITAPAPIPLPASAPLLLLGLAGFGLLRRRGRA